jgi:hypothetical protein
MERMGCAIAPVQMAHLTFLAPQHFHMILRGDTPHHGGRTGSVVFII